MNQNAKITDISTYRKARRRAGNIRWVLILVFLVACMFAGYFFSLSSFFSIREVVVSGNSLVSEQRILELAEVHKGANIFSVDLKSSSAWICIEPRIKSAELRRKLPNQLLIQVEEREAVACMMSADFLLEVDAEGRILQRHRSWSGLELPLISGVELPYSESMPGICVERRGMEEALTIIRSLPDDAEGIGEINVSNPQFIKLYTLSGVEIRLGDCEDFHKKYGVYTGILLDNEMEQGRPLRYIDVSIIDKPTFAVK
ncbi:MAG: FtsQ-type POTRA domain-containing protein [Bacillota bacterium]|nr:FtsQ-type POTRA domain-containing protein [Bacillota bacterium]